MRLNSDFLLEVTTISASFDSFGKITSDIRDRAAPVGEAPIWKRIIKQENVDHRVRTFNGPIRLSQRIGEHKNRDVPLSGSTAELHVAALVSSTRLINVNLIDRGGLIGAGRKKSTKVGRKREKEKEIKMRDRKQRGGGRNAAQLVMPKRKFV